MDSLNCDTPPSDRSSVNLPPRPETTIDALADAPAPLRPDESNAQQQQQQQQQQ
jgi:hypothetical protein